MDVNSSLGYTDSEIFTSRVCKYWCILVMLVLGTDIGFLLEMDRVNILH